MSCYFSIQSNITQSYVKSMLAPLQWHFLESESFRPHTRQFCQKIFSMNPRRNNATNKISGVPNAARATSESVGTIFVGSNLGVKNANRSIVALFLLVITIVRLSFGPTEIRYLHRKKKKVCSGFSLFPVQLKVASQN